MKKSIFIFVLLLPIIVLSQDFKFIPIKYDRLWSEDGYIIRYDAVEHAIRDGAIFWGLGKFGVSNKWRFGLTTAGAIGWEIRDGIAWRTTDGFSWKDLFAGMAGQGLVFAGEKLFSKPKSQKYDEALRKEIDDLQTRVAELERRAQDRIGKDVIGESDVCDNPFCLVNHNPKQRIDVKQHFPIIGESDGGVYIYKHRPSLLDTTLILYTEDFQQSVPHYPTMQPIGIRQPVSHDCEKMGCKQLWAYPEIHFIED